jgi:hypothetical protein
MQPARIKPGEPIPIYSITTFIRALTSLLQIQQFARLRSTTCSLQGLSSTQRSARTTPSRDRTLGAKQERNPDKLSVPRSRRFKLGKTVEGGTQVAVLPRMGRAINPFALPSLALLPALPAASLNPLAVGSSSFPTGLSAPRVMNTIIIIYYSWNGGRAEAVCAGGERSENAMRRSNATACMV